MSNQNPTDDLSIPVILRASAARRRQDWEDHIKDRLARGLPAYTNPSGGTGELMSSTFAKVDEMNREKARGRVATMLAKKAEKAARTDGKVWDAAKAKWVDPA
jgi:hypothetical protein